MTTMRPRESRARDGFIKNFDHRQMGSRMEALVYSETHDDEEERETEKIEGRKREKDERERERLRGWRNCNATTAETFSNLS